MTEPVGAYRALALQTRCDAINALDKSAARAQMLAAIERIDGQIRASKAFIGADVRLVVLPEYFLTAYPLGDSIEAWADKAALAIDGPEYAALARLAVANDVYLSGNAYELDPHFPELYFQTSFIMNSNGERILGYRRLISMFAPTPHDVWDRYLDHYGIEGVFPVVDTPLGRLAAVASEEILYPEVTRALALRGAEVILHSTSEVGSPALTPKDIAKRARAFENNVYVVSANSAGIFGTELPSASADAMSKVVDYEGRVLCEAANGESMIANAELDIEALRRWRRRPGMNNMLSRQRTELFRSTYTGHSLYPANTMLDADGALRRPEREHFVATQRAVIERLSKDGVI